MASQTGGRDRLAAADQVTAPIKSTRVTSTRVVTDRAGMLRDAYSFPILVGIIHLTIVQLAATLAYRYGTATKPSPPFQKMPGPHTGIAHWIVDPVRQWDGLWYRLVAIEGYGKPVA